ncbi:MAG: non-canonical purine NTP pyrophosphatase [Planifilum fulgidum]
MGEVPPELKNRISHRAMAFQGLLRLLKEIYRFEKPVSSEGGGSR